MARCSFPLALAGVVALSFAGSLSRSALAKGKRPPVIGVVADGVAELLYGAPKLGVRNKQALAGKVFTAVCDGATTPWKLAELRDERGLVGSFVSAAKPKYCLLLDTHTPEGALARPSGRPAATEKQIAAAKAAAMTALTPKKGDAPTKLDVFVFHDGRSFVAVAQTKVLSSNEKGSCAERATVVVLEEKASGAWKPFFRPQPKQKNVCGYSFFTRGDVDGDGKDEIALRIEKADEVGYRVLKRSKDSYDVIAR